MFETKNIESSYNKLPNILNKNIKQSQTKTLHTALKNKDVCEKP